MLKVVQAVAGRRQLDGFDEARGAAGHVEDVDWP